MQSPSVPSSAEALPLRQVDKRIGARRIRRQALKATLVFWTFVGPLCLGLFIFVYAPILWSIVLSFFSARNTITPTHFIGLQNYQSMLTDSEFIKSLITFTIFAAFIVPATFVFALGLALLVNSIKFAKGFFRSVFFLPIACSYVAGSLVWKMSLFIGTPYGLANLVLHALHIAPISWTTTPPWFWLVLITVRLWIQLGLYMILFIAGLQDIPRELYEASYVDGAKSGWQTFRYVTFPLLRNASISVLLLNVIAAFQAFDEFINIMTGGNQIQARPPLVYIYNVALNSQDYGRGSAGAIILTLIIIIFTLVQGRFFGFGKSN